MTLIEERLRDSLGALAEQVEPAADSYARAHEEWRRRDRRRRWVALALASALIVVADVVGLWALDRAGTQGGDVLFDHPAPVQMPLDPEPAAPTVP